MRNVIYVCKFKDNELLNESFDFKSEAMDWATKYIDKKPIVEAVDIEYDDFNNSKVYEKEEIFHYPEEAVESEIQEDTGAADLERLSAEVESDEIVTEAKDLTKKSGSVAYVLEHNIDTINRICNAESKESAKDVKNYLIDLIKKEANNTEAARRTIMEFERGPENKKDLLLHVYNIMLGASHLYADSKTKWRNENLGPGEEVNATIAEIDDAAEKYDQEQKLEKELEEELEEDFFIFEPFESDFSECEPMGVRPEEHRADCCDDFCKEPADFLQELARELGIEDQVEIKPVEKEEVSCEGEECCDKENCEDYEDEISEISDEVKDEDSEDIVPEEVKANEKQNDLKDSEEKLDETVAKPELDKVKAFNDALKVAKENNKPVIYGYMGSDKHGGHRYFGIEFIVCDDIKTCTNAVMKKYNPSGSVLVAYPDKDFVEESLDQDYTDEEFAEAFKKGLEEKHKEK